MDEPKPRKTYRIAAEVEVHAADEKEALNAVDQALSEDMPEGTFASGSKLTIQKEKDRQDGRISVYAAGSFEFKVRLGQPWSGRVSMGEFLRVSRRDVDESIRELLQDPEFVQLCNRKNISMRLLKLSQAMTATFEEDR
jgi:hypothetical protein